MVAEEDFCDPMGGLPHVLLLLLLLLLPPTMVAVVDADADLIYSMKLFVCMLYIYVCMLCCVFVVFFFLSHALLKKIERVLKFILCVCVYIYE